MRGIVMATMMEGQPFIEGLCTEAVEKRPFRLYRGGDFFLIISGIGKINAALATAYLINNMGLRKIYNCGAAGALIREYDVGDIRHISSLYEHDRPSIMDGRLKEIIPCVEDGHAVSTLVTGDVPVTGEEQRARLSTVADLVDMEGAAVVRACKIHGAEALLFKIVTDTPDHSLDSEIINNVRKTRDTLFRYFMENCAGKP